MSKVWIVFFHEYLRHVKTKRFLFGLLSLPLTILLTSIIAVGAIVVTTDLRPVGAVDQSGLFQNAQPYSEKKEDPLSVEVLPFPNEETARKALDSGEIQGYYVIQPDYLATGKVRAVSQTGLDKSANDAFSKFLLTHLLKNEDPLVRERMLEGSQVSLKSPTEENKYSTRTPFEPFAVLILGMIFFFAINIIGNYLLRALVDEKENRTMEIILTSLSTDQFMIGKILGNLSVGMTQIFFWFAIPILMGVFALTRIPLLRTINIDLTPFWLMMLLAFPAFIMVAALMTLAGATATESREAQQIASLFSLPFMIPFYFLQIFLEHPDSPLSIGLSLFPFTSLIGLPLRALATSIPTWQSVLAIGLMVLSAVGSIWLASRAFRLSMLRYGKKLSLLEIFRSRA
ncbi:ABC transporter permease [Anaerolinea thermophila]|uniref:Molybdenum ABC transporter permease protein n=1 Tax=Anaerolinea thermophila (strain DSM 14523 / JCM 11388 / NBRC 100420 / UNI-1) TaxID=926569 RepID=E8N3I1_ANATU|nr:ABC transporter permease [Anaerolinea thermophila]BAJ62995.1 molybdenum ABC transporter permease protein [Anaerolinea thermophila UNI-1]